ncbi:MAG: hypothetical protein GX306_02590 [Clostridiales bacterium]|nr:hypothetical protein [Clostridiales bacterium]
MDLDFLKNFTKRMKNIGSYGLLFKNSIPKGTWKQYGIENIFEQTNLIFSVLLYIMEQSLKDEYCTMDDIGNFIDVINVTWFKKPLSYDQCKELGEFIVNVILCDEGRAMYFQGFDYDEGVYKEIHISFIGNKVVYIDGDVRRTSYYLTDDGYNLVLSTLEIESNMKLTIQEMIFKLQMEKASYDKAIDTIKQIFNLLRIQLQKMQEAMRKIRQNALTFSVTEYGQILEDNLSTIDETKKKLGGYKEHVRNLVEGLEQQDIHIEKLGQEEEDNLKHLKIIEAYINRTLDEFQKILSTHFDLKSMYTKELEALSQMSLIKRFSIRNDLYDPILQNPDNLDCLDIFLRPLFNRDVDKIYNIGKAFEYQRSIKLREYEESEVLEDFDEETWLKERQLKLEKKLKVYKDSLLCILRYTYQYKSVSLQKIQEFMTEEDINTLIPNLEIFREIMIELIKNRVFCFDDLRKEREEHFADKIDGFQINLCLLELIEEQEELKGIRSLEVSRLDGEVVEFINVADENGQMKKVRCSNVIFTLE